jgi:RimJ/RimL family protein N-acetyltransferase
VDAGAAPPPAIDTPRTRLVPLPAAAFEAMAAGDVEAARLASGLPLPAEWIASLPWQLWMNDLHDRGASWNEWSARAAVDRSTGEIVANAGFHGPPDQAGMVEIGYSVVTGHRRQGLATEIAGALLRWASTQPAVATLRASTNPTNEASQRVLRHLGFTRIGDQTDDIDGLEWVWERPPFGESAAP